MPENRPRHEVKTTDGGVFSKPKMTFEESFRERRDVLVGRHIGNSALPPDHLPTRTATGVVAGRRQPVEQARDRLDALGTFASDPAGWGARAEASGPDLGGYFNDAKLELSSRFGGNAEWVRLMDYLEYAEREGGLAGWLDRWGEAMGNPALDDMAQIAEQIEKAVVFDRALVNDFLDSPMNRGDAALRQQGQEFLSLLTSVAHEVSRQTSAVLDNGVRSTATGGRMDAVKEAFRRISDRQTRAREVRRDVQELKVHERFDVARGGLDSDTEKRLGDGLQAWQRAAGDLSTLVTRLQGEPDLDQQAPIAALRKGLADIGTAVSAATSNCLGARGGIPAERFLRDLREMADAMIERHASLIPQLTDGEAQRALNTFQSSLTLQRRNMDTMLEMANPVQRGALDAAPDGKLHAFWSAQRDALLREVADPGRRRDLEGVFKEGLGGVLDKWSKARDADAYGLVWQLVDILRTYRAGALAVLQSGNAAERAAATRLTDAMVAAVTARL